MARRRARSRRARRRRSENNWKNVALGVSAAVLLGGLTAGLGDVVGKKAPSETHIAWFDEDTTSASGGIPFALRARIDEVAASRGGGSMTVVPVGEKAAPQTAEVELTVLRDGDREPDPALRRSAIASRLTAMLASIDQADVGTSGYSLYSALARMRDAKDQAGGSLEEWWSTVVLTGSVDPLDMTKLRSFTDPQAAARSLLRGPLGKIDLRGVDLHPILITPIGAGQQALDPTSEDWRAAFVVALAEGLGADVAAPLRDAVADPPHDRASLTQPVAPLAISTPSRPVEPAPAVIGDIGFKKDSPELVDPEATRKVLQSFAQDYLRAGRTDLVVDITGYCARSGPPDGARALSRERARVIFELLSSLQMIPPDAINPPRGVGFDQVADPGQPPLSAAQRVVIVHAHPAAATDTPADSAK